MELHQVAINQIKAEGERINSFYFPVPDDFRWEEGAHIHVALEGFNEGDVRNKELVRHMSITTLPEEGRLGFTTRLDSSDSVYKRALSRHRVGDPLYLFKSGSRLTLRREERPLVVFSMGVAMSAVRPLALCYAQNRQGIASLRSITVNSRQTYPFQEELQALNAPGLSLCHLRHRAELTEEIERLDFLNHPLYYVVGSDEFLRDVITLLRQRGAEDGDIILDMKAEKRSALYERMGL